MRVLFIVSDFFPPCSGSSERVWNIAKELSLRYGVEVILTTYLWRRLPATFEIVKWIPFPRRGRIRGLNFLRWVCQLLRHSKYNIVQVELFSTFKALLFRLILAPLARGFVLVLHDLEWLHRLLEPKIFMKYLLHVSIYLNFKLYNAIIFVSEDIKSKYRRFYGHVLKNKFTAVIPSGIQSRFLTSAYDKMKCRRELGLKGIDFIVVFFGPLHAPFNREAVEYLYRISEAVAQQFRGNTNRDLLFVIAGRGAEKLGSTKILRPIGFVEDLPKLLTAADACIIPHSYSYTGPHVKTLYAFAIGCPVLSTADGVKGLGAKPYIHYVPFDRNDVDSVVRALVMLATHEDSRIELIKHSRALVSGLLWENIAKEYVRFLCKVLKLK
ncbi:MAG: glycosyltransferase family 4 protein [Candidatus Nezhaarchaeota archaeon]|nr:glycosyltransferase family 4 protein [Candidatus Nezhaarchaeota archaeon]